MTSRCRFAGARALGSRLVLVVPAILLVAAGCGSSGGDEAELARGGGRSPTTAPSRYPLTGLNVADAGKSGRSAVTVKIENSPASRPQGGLDKADVVFEAVVEGGQTRFLAVFQSTDADPVGPIRSVRPSDPGVVAPFGGIVAYSGGIPRFVEAMRATGLKNLDENSAGNAFRRRRDKRAPHNLYTSTSALYSKAPGGGAPPKFADFLPAGQPWTPPGAVPVVSFNLPVGTQTNVGYDWDAAAGAWKRSTNGAAHTAEGAGQLTANNVIVQFLAYERTGEVDTTGAPVSEAKVVGSGEAWVFAAGTMVNARWTKTSASAMTTWTDAAGAPLPLPPGRTWVELPATGTPVSMR